jgi:alpha-1,2-glucosyltransferase
LYGNDTVCVSFTIVWFVATSLSLVTAPLVEPRYFLLPWLMWRLAVPEHMPRSEAQQKMLALENKDTDSTHAQAKSASISTSTLLTLLTTAAAYSTWLELLWYLLINLVTCYMFLYRGFEWPQEPGDTQRFMW